MGGGESGGEGGNGEEGVEDGHEHDAMATGGLWAAVWLAAAPAAASPTKSMPGLRSVNRQPWLHFEPKFRKLGGLP